MLGAGINRGIMTVNTPSARLLDVTRLASRAGRGLTGVDRVERAYLVQFLKDETTPLFGLARTVPGYVLLDRAGLQSILDRVDGRQRWGFADVASRLARRLTPMQQRADSDLRRFSMASATRFGLRWLLRRNMPPGLAYLNIGHSNLTSRVLRAVRGVRDARISVFIHDTIPLDYPEFQREGTVERFRESLRRVGRNADLLIYNSARTKGDVERTLARWNMSVRGVVAHLGSDPAVPARSELPFGLPPDRPYFVVVGTIEPRKNHALLLEVWDQLSEDMDPAEVPSLLICGARGWRNEDVFERLDALPADGPVRECPDLSDGALAALIQGAAGLLQPSFAEGFGLPPVEAAALQTPVICADLSVFHEVLGDIPIYLSPTDAYSWVTKIKMLAKAEGRGTGTGPQSDYVPPSWQDHFNTVLRLT